MGLFYLGLVIISVPLLYRPPTRWLTEICVNLVPYVYSCCKLNVTSVKIIATWSVKCENTSHLMNFLVSSGVPLYSKASFGAAWLPVDMVGSFIYFVLVGLSGFEMGDQQKHPIHTASHIYFYDIFVFFYSAWINTGIEARALLFPHRCCSAKCLPECLIEIRTWDLSCDWHTC